MHDDDMAPAVASSPNNALDDANLGDANLYDSVSELLTTLARIPRTALPDGPARDLLACYVRAGVVDNLYRPFGSPNRWLIAWATLPPERDPRQWLDDWLALVSDARLTTPRGNDLIDNDPLWRKLIRRG